MATTLVSRDPSLQVRTARGFHVCHGVGRAIQSPRCTGEIKPGDLYVCKVELRDGRGRPKWIRDIRHYCSHCALANLSAVRVGKAA